MKLEEILQTEATNQRHIYLYRYKANVWGCCGRSALLLNKLYPNISCHERDISGKGDIVPVMIIDPMTLAHLVENIPPLYQDKEKIVIEMPEALAYICKSIK